MPSFQAFKISLAHFPTLTRLKPVRLTAILKRVKKGEQQSCENDKLLQGEIFVTTQKPCTVRYRGYNEINYQNRIQLWNYEYKHFCMSSYLYTLAVVQALGSISLLWLGWWAVNSTQPVYPGILPRLIKRKKESKRKYKVNKKSTSNSVKQMNWIILHYLLHSRTNLGQNITKNNFKM